MDNNNHIWKSFKIKPTPPPPHLSQEHTACFCA